MSTGQLSKNIVKDAVREILKEQKIVDEVKLESTVNKIVRNEIEKERNRIVAEQSEELFGKLDLIMTRKGLKKIGFHALLATMLFITTMLGNICFVVLNQMPATEQIPSIPRLVLTIVILWIVTAIGILVSIKLYDKAKIGCIAFTNTWSVFIIVQTLSLMNSPFSEIIKGLLGK